MAEAAPSSSIRCVIRDRKPYVHHNLRRESTYRHDRQSDEIEGLEIIGNIRSLSLKLFEMKNLTSLYLNNNNLSTIPKEMNLLMNLAHLDVSRNRLTELPPQMGDMISLRELILSHNLLQELPRTVGKLFRLNKLDIDNNRLPNPLMDMWNSGHGVDNLLEFLLNELRDDYPVPPERQWRNLKNPIPYKTKCIFTVMSYNILNHAYATRQMYGYCPNWALEWSYRRRQIMLEINQYDADIISLQEVECDEFENFFTFELNNQGYSGVFLPKSRVRTVIEVKKKHVDGCAIFFKDNKFHVIKKYMIEFSELAKKLSAEHKDLHNRVASKDNIALAIMLQTKRAAYSHDSDITRTNQTILVCNTHLYWDPEFSDVKLVQTILLTNELQSIVKATLKDCDNLNATKYGIRGIPLVLCGDLNSLPNSGVVEFLSSGFVPTKHADFKNIGYEDCLPMSKTPPGDTFCHRLKISRACSDEIMPFTNYSYHFEGVIDYIYYSEVRMIPLKVLEGIDEGWLKTNKIHGCPYPWIPSDHFPVLVQFQLAPTEPVHPPLVEPGPSSPQAPIRSSSPHAPIRPSRATPFLPSPTPAYFSPQQPPFYLPPQLSVLPSQASVWPSPFYFSPQVSGHPSQQVYLHPSPQASPRPSPQIPISLSPQVSANSSVSAVINPLFQPPSFEPFDFTRSMHHYSNVNDSSFFR